MNTQTTPIEEITLINGNNYPYTLPLPKIKILAKWNETALEHVKQNTGLDFKQTSWAMEAQPTFAWQIAALLMTYNFKTRYYNNWNEHNTLILKSDHHVGWQVDSICYDCAQHNHIHTNGMGPDDRLSC